MLRNFDPEQYDLATGDGVITSIEMLSDRRAEAIVMIEGLSPLFVGYELECELVFFNIKSTLAQLGVNGTGREYELDRKNSCAQVRVELEAYGDIAMEMLKHLHVGAYIGKLFAADPRRRVRDPFYLSRMFGRCDRLGRPLLSLGGMHGSSDLILDKVDGRTVAYLSLQHGRLLYAPTVHGFLPTLGKALVAKKSMREVVGLHQEWHSHVPHNVEKDQILLVRTLPLHIRTVFGRVVNELLSEGYKHTSASILQPDTTASGDVYELYGESKRELMDIPLEFYTLEPYREYVFFEDRDQLQTCLEDSKAIFSAFDTAPKPLDDRVSAFVVKGEQMLDLTEDDWIVRQPRRHEFPGLAQSDRQAKLVEKYIEQQPSFPFLKNIDDNAITSQGILLNRYFPSPMMKRMLLSNHVRRGLKGIYFQYPSHSYESYFSAEDRTLLNDLHKFAIPIYWADSVSGQILEYVQKPDCDFGIFVPLYQRETFIRSTVFGIYGSNLIEGEFEDELRCLLQGILDMRKDVNHPLLYDEIPLSLVTGGGPGAMEVGNRVAKELGILSCANVVDFRQSDELVVNEQKMNPYIEAKMTYRLDKLVERQSEFNLDFPIFLKGGIGTDFEFCLEEVRRKVGATPPNPILLMGSADYWRQKITPRFQCNLQGGTIRGSEWLSNCFYCIQTAEQGLQVYRDFFEGTLPIGKDGPVHEDGFVVL